MKRMAVAATLLALALHPPAVASDLQVRWEPAGLLGVPAGGPWLGAAHQDGVTLSWRLPEALATVLVLRGPDGREWRRHTFPASEGGRARLSGLVPGQSYPYELWDQAGQLVGKGRLAAAAPRGRRLRVAVVGDTGGGTPGQVAVGQAIGAWRPDMVLHLGDVIYERGEAAAYGPRYLRPYAAWLPSVPVYPAVGNHDLLTGQGAPFDAFFDWPGRPFGPQAGPRHYRFVQGEVQFIALDSNVPFGPGTAQHRFLQESLAQGQGLTWRLPFFHHPMYSGGAHGSSQALRRAWGPEFERHNAQLVLAGHDHHYERSSPREDYVQDGRPTTYLVSGGGGAWLRAYRPQPFSAFGKSIHHFVGLDIGPNLLVGEALTPEGRVLDRFELRP